mmetsp:Transcript_19540/g.59079  ORF Transcript_19540/g.59079 Transcript_19540/m.59079 type:complete len:243 (-) Transcript_19540:1304-2032(-)
MPAESWQAAASYFEVTGKSLRSLSLSDRHHDHRGRTRVIKSTSSARHCVGSLPETRWRMCDRAYREVSALVHAAHAAHTAAHTAAHGTRIGRGVVRGLHDDGLGGGQQRGDPGGVGEGGTHHLQGVNDARLHHVLEHSISGVVADVGGGVALQQLAHDDGALLPRIVHNHPRRLLHRPLQGRQTHLLVEVGDEAALLEASHQPLGRVQQRRAAPRYDALLDCGLGGVESVSDPVLLLNHLHL